MATDHEMRMEALRLFEENEKLREALKECVTALDSKEMEGVWAYLYAHGFKYTGPAIDMNRLRRLLTIN